MNRYTRTENPLALENLHAPVVPFGAVPSSLVSEDTAALLTVELSHCSSEAPEAGALRVTPLVEAFR